MYYVYYIKGKKVGCTKDLKKRVEEEQGHKDYQILFESTDIKKASNAERYWQEKLGYPPDPVPYYELITRNNNLKTKKMIKKTNQTITFKVDPKEITKDFLLNLITIQDVNGVDIDINEDLADWILKNLKKSQFNNEMFVYNQSLINAYEYLLENKNKSVFDNIRHWAEQRGLYDKGDSKTQYVKLQEEAGELAKALLNKDKLETIDAIGDMVVVLTNLAHLEGLKIEECISSAYNVIKSRQGKMVNGTFVKNK
jgi:NTP pyrophosphatase (non-canonical NTP hydrolase)